MGEWNMDSSGMGVQMKLLGAREGAKSQQANPAGLAGEVSCELCTCV